MEDHPQFVAWLGRSGRILAGSKSGYHRDHPDHFAIFNAGICVERGGHPELLWEGDLDLTLDEQHLVDFAKAHRESLFVVVEGDRPDAFHGSRGEVLGRAEVVIDPDGEVSFNERRVRRDSEGRLRLDLDRIAIDALRLEAAMLRGRCERLDKLVVRGIERGWVTSEEREKALWFPEAGQ